jgi:hypothetical protein
MDSYTRKILTEKRKMLYKIRHPVLKKMFCPLCKYPYFDTSGETHHCPTTKEDAFQRNIDLGEKIMFYVMSTLIQQSTKNRNRKIADIKYFSTRQANFLEYKPEDCSIMCFAYGRFVAARMADYAEVRTMKKADLPW